MMIKPHIIYVLFQLSVENAIESTWYGGTKEETPHIQQSHHG